MLHSSIEMKAVQDAGAVSPALLQRLEAVEAQLAQLGQALHQQDSRAIDTAAAALHQALAHAVDHFGRAARNGGVPRELRQRLAVAGGQVAAQREALARATASLDRAMDVLMPRVHTASLYSAAGGTDRAGCAGGALLA
jgi:ABC-type transporter Mla subunit MlaD